MSFVDELRQANIENSDYDAKKLLIPEKELKEKLLKAAKQSGTSYQQLTGIKTTNADMARAVELYKQYPSLEGIDVSWRNLKNGWRLFEFKW